MLNSPLIETYPDSLKNNTAKKNNVHIDANKSISSVVEASWYASQRKIAEHHPICGKGIARKWANEYYDKKKNFFHSLN